MIVVRVDHRERDSEVPRMLEAAGASVRIVSLKSGDYHVGPVGVERKTESDLARSIVDGRLFRQAGAMRRAYSRPLLIVEGLTAGSDREGVP